MEKKNLRKKIFNGLTIISLGIVGFLGIKEASLRLSDKLLQTQKEVSLEQRIGKQIYFGLTDRGKERDQRIQWFSNSYNNARQTWDNFDKQFDKVWRIFLLDPWKSNYGGRATLLKEIKIRDFAERVIVHELAHLWYYKQGMDFYNKWEKISNNHYVNSNKKKTIGDLIKNGAVSWDSLKNQSEDIAQTTHFVFELNHPDYNLIGFPNNKPSFRKDEYKMPKTYSHTTVLVVTVPKIMKKLELLKKYDFFSEREYKHAISELKGFKEKGNK